jgi:periplasmic protein TonB
MTRKQKKVPLARRALDLVLVAFGSTAPAAACFLVLPLMQAVAKAPAPDLTVRDVDVAQIPPPPPPSEPEPEPEPEPEEKPPELTEDAPPLDLAQLEMALNPGAGGLGGDVLKGDFAVKLDVDSEGGGVDAIFSMADLDQKPRVVYQPSPALDAEIRKRAPGAVYVLFVVDESGRVENPTVQKSSDQVFERSALAAVKQWRFEPGKRGGKPVRFRMRVPITFPKD